ncbi:MAG: insulinase family protein [Gemmatimonadales bacterium]|nr:insulinase family protein [Gemmatimonadales bacterium]MYG48240.1 insulinase family protein [Gemmatimonadales bacterium]MYK02776.1 insulinase family protein [Candidatus Palauibacter ramosifaciens]
MKMSRLPGVGFASIAMVLFSSLSAPGAAGQAPADPIPPDPAVIAGTLDNGLRYFVRENDQPENRAELRLVVNAGSILEDEDQLGLAHFVEHMAFNGTENFEKQALVDYLESIGMQFGPDINAYTSFDETVYMLQVPMDDPEMLATAFRILGDWAQGVRFDPEEVDKERGVVIEEWRGRRGAAARIQDRQFPVLFQGSLYAERLPIGKTEILETAPAERLRDFYEDWYRPDLMAIIAVGDFDGAEIEATIRERFGKLTGPAEPRPRIAAEVPLDHPPLVTIVTDPEAQGSQVGVLYKQPPAPRGTIGDFRRGLVEGLYSGMLNARLNELRLQADPPFMLGFFGQGQFSRGVDAYQLVAFVAEGGIERGLEALLTEAERVVQYGFTSGELEREKTNTRRGYERRLAERENQESAALANRYIQVFLQGSAYPGLDTQMELVDAFLPGITLEETNGIAEAWLAEQGRVVLASAPAKAGLEPPAEDDLLGVFAAVGVKEVEAYEDEAADAPLLPIAPEGTPIASEEVLDGVGVTIWTLENGVRVVLKPTDFKDDEIIFSATSPGGTSLVSDDVFRRISFALSVVSQSGVGDFDQTALGKKLAGKAVRVSPSVGSLSEGLGGAASPQDVETAFQLIYLYFSAPRRDETMFEALKAQQMAMLANVDANPNLVFSDTISATMSRGHPRILRSSQLASSLEEADLDAAYDLYRDRFADASDFTFYFTGAFDLPTIRPLVEQYLGALPDLGRVEEWRDLGIDPPAGVIETVVHKGLEPQSRTQIIFAGEAGYSLEEANAIAAMADVLDIRLREVLREDMGGTYGVGVGGSLSYRPDEEYRFSISFGSDPERAQELSDVVFEEIERLKAEGPDAETVDKVRETQRRTKETNLQENRYWLSRLASFERAGRDLNEIPSYEWIESWTAEQVREAAVRYLRTDQYARFVLLPEQKVP